MNERYIYSIVLIIIFAFVLYYVNVISDPTIEGMTSNGGHDEYIQKFNDKNNRMFPFRYFTDENDKILPFVAVTGFFRGKDAEDRYNEYLENGINIFGITAYKSFPNRQLLDVSEGEYERNDTFNFTEKIQNWLCCFKNKEKYGFTDWNKTIDISESDFYNAEEDNSVEKKYDFIYICNKDNDECPMDGWNAINRNFDLAKKCFPIMCFEFGMKGLIVGREGCGLEEKYGEKMEIVGWLDWHILQTKMRESKFLFVPNVFDASPRVIAECITKDLPVLMNKNILCGNKYVTKETGELYTDENDIRQALINLLEKQNKISPKKWWSQNYSQNISQKKLRDFLAECFKGELDNVAKIKFIL